MCPCWSHSTACRAGTGAQLEPLPQAHRTKGTCLPRLRSRSFSRCPGSPLWSPSAPWAGFGWGGEGALGIWGGKGALGTAWGHGEGKGLWGQHAGRCKCSRDPALTVMQMVTSREAAADLHDNGRECHPSQQPLRSLLPWDWALGCCPCPSSRAPHAGKPATLTDEAIKSKGYLNKRIPSSPSSPPN